MVFNSKFQGVVGLAHVHCISLSRKPLLSSLFGPTSLHGQVVPWKIENLTKVRCQQEVGMLSQD